MVVILIAFFAVLGVLVHCFYFVCFPVVCDLILFGILFSIHMYEIFHNQIPLIVALFQYLHIVIQCQSIFYW